MLQKLMAWLRPEKTNDDMRSEMEFHLASRRADLVRNGMSEDEAERQARIEFGSQNRYQEEGRAALGLRVFDEIRNDAGYCLRLLAASPGFAVATISILAIAIGVNTAFFTLYSNYVLKPMAIPRVDQHFRAETRDVNQRGAGGFSEAEMETLAASTRGVVDGIYGVSTIQVLLLKPEQRHAMVSVVSKQYFPLLDGRPALGQIPVNEMQSQPIAVLSSVGHARLFPASQNPVGESIRVRDRLYRIAAVMPATFQGTEPVVPDLWVGLGMQPFLRGEADTGPPRTQVHGFTATGASFTQAATALTSIASRLSRPNGEPIARVQITPMSTMLPEIAEQSLVSLLIFTAFLLVLLIACANLTNLNLARSAVREHEIGMRIQLGASTGRIVRQLLTESVITGTIGAGLGMLLALAGIERAQDMVASMSGIAGLTMQPVTPDWRTFAYSAVLGLLAGVGFGLLPALELSKPKSIGRARPRRMRNALIAGQVAASLVLLLFAGLLTRNMQKLDSIEAGFDLEHTYDLRMDASPQVIAAIEKMPEVEMLSAVSSVPLMGSGMRRNATIAGRRERIQFNHVDEKYLPLLQLPVEGRNFERNETVGRAHVAIISRATAARLFPGRPAIGGTFELDETDAGTYQVIGVVPDVISGFIFMGPDRTAVYLPGAAGQKGMESLLARIPASASTATRALRQMCLDMPGGTGCDPTSLQTLARMQRFPFALAAALAAVLGSIALLLTAIGLYSVVSYSVVQRRREIGIQMALGAMPRNVIFGLLRESSRCVAYGLLAGLPVCLLLSQLASSTVIVWDTFDPLAYALVPLLLAAVAALAAIVPARAASRLDPIEALRQD